MSTKRALRGERFHLECLVVTKVSTFFVSSQKKSGVSFSYFCRPSRYCHVILDVNTLSYFKLSSISMKF